MNPLLLALWLLPLLAALFLWALIVSRTGKSGVHTRAFYSGAVGLLAIPAWLAGFSGMVLQLFWASFASPAGVLFVSSSLALLASTAVSIISLATLRAARGAV
jgi:formate hydrogenlyase subunit 3/multisubunit Na+/H+ antiporter MnhD subunit